ncbi:MAG TPA: hypothetical protein VG963_25430 [Polyangiaceae bacterium]|nr:hypothetical protein [Polyangiaceae bacterium]
MPRNLIQHVAYDAEPMLAEVSRPEARRSWLPQAGTAMRPLDVTYWRVRAARGFSWHRSGHVHTSSRSH